VANDYKPDHKGIAQLLVAPSMMKVVALYAEAGMPYAVSISPDADPYGEGYVSSFEVEAGLTVKTGGNRRAAARLVNTTDHAAHVEWTNGDRVLGRTVDYIEKLKL
jgi:hypothetical protein